MPFRHRCLYLNQKQFIIVVVLYVDDVLFMGNNETLIKEKKTASMKKWECRDLGPISEYLQMDIRRYRKNRKLIINYAKKVVECFGQQNAKPTYSCGQSKSAFFPISFLQLQNASECSSYCRIGYLELF